MARSVRRLDLLLQLKLMMMMMRCLLDIVLVLRAMRRLLNYILRWRWRWALIGEWCIARDILHGRLSRSI